MFNLFKKDIYDSVSHISRWWNHRHMTYIDKGYWTRRHWIRDDSHMGHYEIHRVINRRYSIYV